MLSTFRPCDTDSGRRTRLGFLCGREAGRLVRHESRRRGYGAGCWSSERRRSRSGVPVGPGSDGGAALSGDLAVSAGSHDRGRRGGDELRAALDRATARPLQRERSGCAGRPAPAQRRRAARAQARASRAVACALDPTTARWRPVVQPQSGGLDGGRTRACCGLAPTRLGGPAGDQLVGAEAAPAPSCRGHAGGVRDI